MVISGGFEKLFREMNPLLLIIRKFIANLLFDWLIKDDGYAELLIGEEMF